MTHFSFSGLWPIILKKNGLWPMRVTKIKWRCPFSFRYIGLMAQPVGNSTQKKLIRIDVSSDTVCPWCFVGKKNLNKAMDSSEGLYDFEVWFFLFRSLISLPPDFWVLTLPFLSFSLLCFLFRINGCSDRQVRWHPFFLDPSAPKEGVNKSEFYKAKFGSQSEQIMSRMREVFPLLLIG